MFKNVINKMFDIPESALKENDFNIEEVSKV